MDSRAHINHNQYADLQFSERLTNVWDFTQRGLVYPSPHAIFAIGFLADGVQVGRDELAQLMAQVRQQIHTSDSLRQSNTSLVLGVGIALWKQICQKSQLTVPAGLTLNFPDPEDENNSTVFNRSNSSFNNADGDLWFHIKSDSEYACSVVLEAIQAILGDQLQQIQYEKAASKSTEEDGHGGKVLGCRFSENLNNPADPVTIAKHSVVGSEDVEHVGASYVLAQRFEINWEQLHSMSEDQIEDLIGRKTDDTIIPNRDTRSHIKSARVQDERGNTTPVLRLGLPFGRSPYLDDPSLSTKGSNVADEKGIFFAGYAKSFGILENIMNNQIGSTANFMNDRLFNHVKSDLGGFFYIPSILDLGLDQQPDYISAWSGKSKLDWKRFPGVNWSRLDRHFRKELLSPYLYYNHKHYLYRMATMSQVDRELYNAPSIRILSLMENAFSRWQDNWYINRKQQEMGHITEYLDQYQGNDKPLDIMSESVMIRKGWAIRLTLHLYTSENYGFRGQRLKIGNQILPFCGHYQPPEGEIINGADTFRIEPEEIIVGGMPNLSLAQGRYVMKYLSEEERYDAFLVNLSEASGVGHVIPAFDKVLDHGVQGLIDMLQAKVESADNIEAKELFQSAIISLHGMAEYSLRYAELAEGMAQQCTAGQAWEKQNLQQIAQRMRKLAYGKPDTFVEATQLIYSLHCCLHLNGEPTSLGRLDQDLNRFYEADIKAGILNEQSAQEIMDAFFIKLDEKVQQNRINIEDHQPFGNLAMGGSSGPYPQGGAVNQWVQQLTVGGTVASNDPNVDPPAYNTLTKLSLRAIGRLPLNAPCLSLRVREDIPDEIVEEAAKAILSGGAHPILLSDKLLIDGLHRCGNGVGGDDIEAETEGRWNSEVSLYSARNYACDGCYEPQFPGENWFALGGLTTPQPLECALNRGKTYSSAGMGYWYGQVVSFTSKPVEEIASFDELVELYFKHFEWLNRKNTNGQLQSFGANTQYCPSPLLSVFVNNCIDKGVDYYSGGAKYNIYGFGFTGLSTTINSLYAIRTMVFDDKRAVTSLPELLECLCCDWGYKMTEPFVSAMAGEARIAAKADRFKRLREIALSQPRYGRGYEEIDQFGDEFISRLAQISIETFTHPIPQTQATMKAMAMKMGTKEYPFGLQYQAGVGTFENHVEMGAWSGASADGRRLGTTIASDLSAAPSPADLPVEHQQADFIKAMAGFGGEGSEKLVDGAPTDFNIAEDFPLDSLKQVIHTFAKGACSNTLTVTTASPHSFTEAMSHPEQYDLLRVRTGGWTEYFTSMFPDKQQQHRRRPLSTPSEG